ncbi:helveticin J family class III bacteriocin [Lactobacillus sp. LL6]|uniref:helveticin J family class III bacteriocin n=1 Tax=Lactobacillus sp. LL6 TaxID=2596827 RepID=UPI0011863C45|nr:helveticin J family class III bacteriocin [Lactobacillus sp. LL6]TSO25569.1 bacteriocin [Lactobacillus sp. LL6]
MSQINNVNVSPAYYLNNVDDGDDDLWHVVVQKGNVGSKYVYALQLRNDQQDIYVSRGTRELYVPFNKYDPVVVMHGQGSYSAGGHTQTWEYANQSGDWFIGTKKMDNGWTKQIARIHIPAGKIYYNTDVPRLSYLNYAGGMYYSGNNMKRVEAAVSTNYKYFMIASGDTDGNGYFSLYYLNDVNSALNNAGTTPVDIRNISYVKSFEIPNIESTSVVGSLQGFDVDENGDYIYISSQKAGDPTNRKIVKIPWGDTNTSDWDYINLSYATSLDIANHYTEFEGIQLIGNNDLYLTVAYHNTTKPGNMTDINRIYRVNW